MNGQIIRVFPRKTKATPLDDLVRFGPPGMFDEADEVHVSVTFTYDKPVAERLAEEWRHVAPTRIGGVAYGDRGDEFVPGRYIKHGTPHAMLWRPETPSQEKHKPDDRWRGFQRLWARPAIIHAQQAMDAA
jgi:hypothetical protein